MTRILVFSGAGPYADRWHPFPETSSAVAEVLTEAGHEVVVRDSDPGSLRDVAAFDLLVVNSGGRAGGADPRDTESWAADHRALAGFHSSGGAILGLHTAVGTFPDWDGWSSIIGGRWTSGSFHPAMGPATFAAAPGAGAHPVFAGLTSVEVNDEKYSLLEVAESSTHLVVHTTDGRDHTMGWAVGKTVVYDGLGHDGRSYASPDRRRLLRNEVDWLLSVHDLGRGLESSA